MGAECAALWMTVMKEDSVGRISAEEELMMQPQVVGTLTSVRGSYRCSTAFALTGQTK